MTIEDHHVYIAQAHSCLSCGQLTTNPYTCGPCQATAETICGDDSLSIFVERAQV